MMGTHKGTKICAFCKQELAHALYYRHLMGRNVAVCQGKLVRRPTGVSSSDEDSGRWKLVSSMFRAERQLWMQLYQQLQLPKELVRGNT